MSIQAQTTMLVLNGDVGRTEIVDWALRKARGLCEIARVPHEMDLANDIEMYIAWSYDNALRKLEGHSSVDPLALIEIANRLNDSIGSGAVAAIATCCAASAKKKYTEIKKRGGRYEGHDLGDADRCDGSVSNA